MLLAGDKVNMTTGPEDLVQRKPLKMAIKDTTQGVQDLPATTSLPLTTHAQPLSSARVQYVQEPIAIIGLACRLPGNCNTPTALWDFLEACECAKNEPPTSRFTLRGHYDGSKKPITMTSPGGMFLERIDPRDIDAQFFKLSKADAIAMDPQQRQLLEVVYEGLENAGVSLEKLSGQPFGCFVGSYASGKDLQYLAVLNLMT